MNRQRWRRTDGFGSHCGHESSLFASAAMRAVGQERSDSNLLYVCDGELLRIQNLSHGEWLPLKGRVAQA
jgi:hypothetical protein